MGRELLPASRWRGCAESSTIGMTRDYDRVASLFTRTLCGGSRADAANGDRLASLSLCPDT